MVTNMRHSRIEVVEPHFRPLEAISKCFRNYKNFRGRASRSELKWFTILTILCAWPLLLTAYSTDLLIQIFSFLYLILTLAVITPQIAVWVRRMHDIGKSGRVWALILVPVLGWFLLWRWSRKPGDPEDNAYGPVLVTELP